MCHCDRYENAKGDGGCLELLEKIITKKIHLFIKGAIGVVGTNCRLNRGEYVQMVLSCYEEKCL